MTTSNPLMALGGTRGARGSVSPSGDDRPTRTLGRWAAGLALGGLALTTTVAAARYMRRAAPAQTPTRDTVTVAWTERASLFGHPAALMQAATSIDLNVELKREAWEPERDNGSLENAARVLFVRMGERLSGSDIEAVRRFFDRRRSSRCLVVLMYNADLQEATTKAGAPCRLSGMLSAEHYVATVEAAAHTRTSKVPIECVYAFFDEETLHGTPNDRAVDAIAAFILRDAPLNPPMIVRSATKTKRCTSSHTAHSECLVLQKDLPVYGRAHAHYGRADRYRRMRRDDKRLSHLRRGDHYARMAAFGIDHSQHPVSTLMVGYDPNPIEDDEAPLADLSLSWTRATTAQALAVDALLIAELKGEIGTFAYGDGTDVWAACRDEQTGGVYIAKCSPGRPEELQDPRPKVRRELGLKAAPRDALANIRAVEDWRASMLMVNTPNGWVYATGPQVFAYHDLMLTTKDPGANASYANVAFRDWCRERYKSSVARDCRDIIIPDSYFPPVGFLSSWFAARQNVQFWMRRDESRPSVIETRDSTQGPWFEVRPASLVSDAPIQAVMPKHVARMILGIVEENPDEKWVRTVVERFVGAIDLDAGFDAGRCRAVQNAAYSLYPHSTFECSADAVRRHRREAREAAEAEAAAQKRLRSAKEAKLRTPTAVERTIPWAYSLLGIKVGATGEEVQKAYRNATRIYHPDKGGNELDFKLVREAFDLIKMAVFSGTLFGRAPKITQTKSINNSTSEGPTPHKTQNRKTEFRAQKVKSVRNVTAKKKKWTFPSCV